jgi:hypothetical protein
MLLDKGPRIIAIDWSGARRNAQKKIWLAEVLDHRLVRLEAGRDRNEVAEHLIVEATKDHRLIVGFDFAFSLPSWFLHYHGCGSVRDLWQLAGRGGDAWLSACESPFWGRSGKCRPLGHERFRRTEIEVRRTGGISPKSAFQIGGAGAVGTGSVRGMPILLRLKKAGFSVWPFDPSDWPTVIEIYPRLLTGPVKKNRPKERRDYLAQRYSSCCGKHLELAASCDDAFDAAVSAFVMSAHVKEIDSLPQASDSQLRLEGAIWAPQRLRPMEISGATEAVS